MNALPDHLVDSSQLYSISFLALLVMFIADVFKELVQNVKYLTPKMFSFFVALIFTMLMSFSVGSSGKGFVVDFIVGLANGVLVALTAIGGRSVIQQPKPIPSTDESGPGPGGSGKATVKDRIMQSAIHFLRPW